MPSVGEKGWDNKEKPGSNKGSGSSSSGGQTRGNAENSSEEDAKNDDDKVSRVQSYILPLAGRVYTSRDRLGGFIYEYVLISGLGLITNTTYMYSKPNYQVDTTYLQAHSFNANTKVSNPLDLYVKSIDIKWKECAWSHIRFIIINNNIIVIIIIVT
ncbi:uncharacterized protein CLUP02_04901 [Colletotrichum lupini]|uniref:Uncharacterized protein n=1 Tax=Colletotrichum lupini TaxID=145971 RepID=A0A9Q8SM99_9PEZI|nr:uncharacterized protein CLUP02_04901 [Colletotrichum lupini]UQC79421.1 hypothetical protein CLUP02_04901 [Colletotrichum lupini]